MEKQGEIFFRTNIINKRNIILAYKKMKMTGKKTHFFSFLKKNQKNEKETRTRILLLGLKRTRRKNLQEKT
jgi:hypothetical protein